MFEKDAIVRANRKYPIPRVYDELDVARNRKYEEWFRDGAEFGYNKANEWHYVKDGKYPAHSNRVLVFTDEGVGFGIYGLDNKKWYTYDTGFDVIAWKEIILPKENK